MLNSSYVESTIYSLAEGWQKGEKAKLTELNLLVELGLTLYHIPFLYRWEGLEPVKPMAYLVAAPVALDRKSLFLTFKKKKGMEALRYLW